MIRTMHLFWSTVLPRGAVEQAQALLGEPMRGDRALSFDAMPAEELASEVHRAHVDNGRDCTLAEVGAALGVSRERVRQIEVVALEKCRAQFLSLQRTGKLMVTR